MTKIRTRYPDKAAWARAMAADRLKQAASLPKLGTDWRRRRAIEATRAALLAQAARFTGLAERYAPDASAAPF